MQSLTVYVAALSSPIRAEMLHTGVARLQEAGCTVVVDDDVLARDWLTAGSRRQRLDAWQRWLASDIPVLWLARGGYGLEEIIDDLALTAGDTDVNQGGPRSIVGSSDATILQAVADKNYRCVYGPMVATSLARLSAVDAQTQIAEVLGLLSGESDNSPLANWLCNQGTGTKVFLGKPYWGGCLSLLVSTAIRGCFPPTGSVVVIEDIGERPHKIERMLDQLYCLGFFEQTFGVIFGQFPGCDPVEGSGYSMHELLLRWAERRNVPAVTGCPVGHVADDRDLVSFVQNGPARKFDGKLSRS